jgi:hypothetical protein
LFSSALNQSWGTPSLNQWGALRRFNWLHQRSCHHMALNQQVEKTSLTVHFQLIV